MFIGLFIFLDAQAKATYMQAKSLLSGYKVKDALMKDYKTITKQETIAQALQLLLNGESKNFLVMEN
ncbi:MAG: hypothetical protein IPO63_02950 [Bacteroidetes bacterium]|nr:hypothetical protein [Bacteroidota bacterium]